MIGPFTVGWAVRLEPKDSLKALGEREEVGFDCLEFPADLG